MSQNFMVAGHSRFPVKNATPSMRPGILLDDVIDVQNYVIRKQRSIIYMQRRTIHRLYSDRSHEARAKYVSVGAPLIERLWGLMFVIIWGIGATFRRTYRCIKAVVTLLKNFSDEEHNA